ncbi:unnamed protein product [Mesocestoides corti]|uniref:Proteasome activator PA28 C-terminal domain-containing protein n=1 Tax=Mesocestoides corti TaxID=53468 RepID=A0A158QVE3_MESCO|nr:unnamed protein product [Mesocestoides corti]
MLFFGIMKTAFVADDVVSRLQKYKEQTKTDGETLVRTVFPKRVFEMEQLLATKLFNFPSSAIYKKINLPVPLMGDRNGSVETCDSDGDKASTKPPGCPVYTFPGGVVPHNEHIKEMIEKNSHLLRGRLEHQLLSVSVALVFASSNASHCPTSGFVFWPKHIDGPTHLARYERRLPSKQVLRQTTKPHLTQLMVEAQLVRLWIQFNVPRIEDGNNFGVGIQEEVLSEASGIERDALTFLDQFTRYYASRGKLVGKAAKFPHIDDYRECIRDMDEKQAISMRYVIMEIRNHYAVLHDLIVKNIDRIKVPRSNNTMTMY